MTNPLLIKGFVSTAAIAGYLIVAAAGDRKVKLATAATDPLLGAAGSMGVEVGGVLDVTQAGWSEVRLGGNVSHGDKLTADANGKAVKAVPVAGTVVHIIGVAQGDGVLNDIIPYQVAPSVLATPA